MPGLTRRNSDLKTRSEDDGMNIQFFFNVCCKFIFEYCLRGDKYSINLFNLLARSDLYFIKGKLTKVISKVHVHDDVYELLGEISDSDESSDGLETYLLSEYNIKSDCCDSQDAMARTKQTAKKTDPKTGQMPPASSSWH